MTEFFIGLSVLLGLANITLHLIASKRISDLSEEVDGLYEGNDE